jgi:hypothetical protein
MTRILILRRSGGAEGVRYRRQFATRLPSSPDIRSRSRTTAAATGVIGRVEREDGEPLCSVCESGFT